MTTRWKRLTALMLILLTLLNAGSALAAEEFWKWGDVYEEKLILGQPAKVPFHFRPTVVWVYTIEKYNIRWNGR